MRGPSFATVLVGPRGIFREGLSLILGAADFCIVATAVSVDDVVLGPMSENQPILLILHAGSDQDATVREIKVFKEQHPSARVALLADHAQLSNSDMVAALRAGADACLMSANSHTFIKSLELLIAGNTILPPTVLPSILHPHPEAVAGDLGKSAEELTEAGDSCTPRLSDREKSILRCLIEGDSNKIIARKSDIAEATVKVHVKAILRKIRVNNRTQAAIWWMSNGSLSTRSPCTMSKGSPAEATMVPKQSLNGHELPALSET